MFLPNYPTSVELVRNVHWTSVTIVLSCSDSCVHTNVETSIVQNDCSIRTGQIPNLLYMHAVLAISVFLIVTHTCSTRLFVVERNFYLNLKILLIFIIKSPNMCTLIWNMCVVAACLNYSAVRALMVIESCANDRAQYRKCVHAQLEEMGIDMDGMRLGCMDKWACCNGSAFLQTVQMHHRHGQPACR